jgi:hypothetical protein
MEQLMTLTQAARVARYDETVNLARSEAAKGATDEASRSIMSTQRPPDIKLESTVQGNERAALANLELEHTQVCDCMLTAPRLLEGRTHTRTLTLHHCTNCRHSRGCGQTMPVY